MTEQQEYLRHQKGLTLLWLWMDQWLTLDGWTFENSELRLSHLCSQRFALGAPKSRRGVRGTRVFLGVQPAEERWLKRIRWSKVVLDSENECLWLVSATHESPDKAWPDLPPLAVGIRINPEILETWRDNKMEWRGVWWDDDNRSHVAASPAGEFSVQRGTLDDRWSAQARASLKTLRDIVMENLEETSVEYDPGFSGSMGELSKEQQEYLQPFKAKGEKAEKAVEEDYPELFGQFLDEAPKGKKK